MKNKVLDDIKKSIVATLNSQYGYAGMADGENMAMINSGGESENFIITIKDQSALDKEKAEKKP